MYIMFYAGVFYVMYGGLMLSFVVAFFELVVCCIGAVDKGDPCVSMGKMVAAWEAQRQELSVYVRLGASCVALPIHWS